MSHPFGDLVHQHLNRKQGFSRNKLADGIGQDPSVISRMCHGQRLSGPLARDRVLSIITYFQHHRLLIYVDEANALLEAAGLARLRTDDDEEGWLLKELPDRPEPEAERLNTADEALSGHPQKDVGFKTAEERAIVYQLNAWKIVHFRVQELLLAVLVLENDIKQVLHERTKSTVSQAEDTWYTHCDNKADDIVVEFQHLQLINQKNALIGQLQYLLKREHRLSVHLENCVRKTDDESFRRVLRNFYRLKELLIQLLRTADHEISLAAQELIARYEEDSR
jgi:hypothetical protein